MALNMGMLASNDQAKEMIEAAGFEKGGNAAVLGGATIAGELSVLQWAGALRAWVCFRFCPPALIMDALRLVGPCIGCTVLAA